MIPISMSFVAISYLLYSGHELSLEQSGLITLGAFSLYGAMGGFKSVEEKKKDLNIYDSSRTESTVEEYNIKEYLSEAYRNNNNMITAIGYLAVDGKITEEEAYMYKEMYVDDKIKEQPTMKQLEESFSINRKYEALTENISKELEDRNSKLAQIEQAYNNKQDNFIDTEIEVKKIGK